MGHDVGVSINPSLQLVGALLLLLVLASAASRVGRLGFVPAMLRAGARAVLQLVAVSFIVVAAISHLWSSGLFVLAMFGVAVYTTARRVGSTGSWQWTALAIAAGVLPVLLIVFLTGTAPLNGYALLPIGSIIVGNMMTVHTLGGRRAFPELRAGIPSYEAALALGLQRREAIRLVLEPSSGEALVPSIDSTRTVGVVTLPGAFIGVLLGGGTPLQAGASQMLVLFGILAGQAVTLVTMNALIERALLLPSDLKARLRP
ncbi:MAG: ABC transporter permease [Propionibacterium sp.]